MVRPSIKGLEHVSDVVTETNRIIEMYKTGLIKPYKTFSAKLNDKITGIYKGDQIVIAGRSGTGKSAYALMLIKELAVKYPELVIIYWTFEMKAWKNIARIYSSEMRIPVKDLLSATTQLSEENFISLINAGNDIKDLNMYFREIPVNYMQWESKVREIQKIFPNQTIVNVVDHFRLTTSANERTEEEKITNLSRAGVRVKNELECINIFLSQLNRKIEEGDRTDVGTTGILQSYIFGGDSIVQDSDLILALHRPEVYQLSRYKGLDTKNLIVTQILKQREGELCEIAMYHNLAINKIYDNLPTQGQLNFNI